MNLIERIKHVLDSSELSSSAFADQLGVQRSSISHILSGRNKPSLDFVLKLLKAFPEVAADWLLLGEEKKEPSTPLTPSLFPEQAEINPRKLQEVASSPTASEPITKESTPLVDEIVERVVVFYTNGTCSTYSNKK